MKSIVKLEDDLVSILREIVKEEQPFFTLTVSTDEICMIKSCENTPDGWSDYKIMELTTPDPGKDEAGILAPVTREFASRGIPILCNSTNKCNYIMFPLDREEEVNNLIEISQEFFFD